MTATLTQNVMNAPTPPVKRPIAALDAGNRTTQWIDPANVVRTIPSCIKMLEDWEEAQLDQRSVLIEVLDNSGEIKERFIIGEEAQRQKGVSAFTGNKCEMAKRLVYAALEPLPGTNTVIVHDKLKAKLKVPRPVSVKQPEGALEAFKKKLPQRLGAITEKVRQVYKSWQRLRYWCQDESRMGLHTMRGRLLTLKGVKPKGKVQWNFQALWLYGLVEPLTGDSFFYDFCHLDTVCA